jgi:Spy/CpxP family protein refolding chaperone
MRRLSLALLLCIGIVPAFCQTSLSKYQPGTIVAVERHRAEPSDTDNELTRYDVTVRIDETLYVVLFTPVSGSNTVEFSEGLEFLFSVGKDALTFATPGKREANTELPILRTSKLPPQPAIDWTKAPSQYYSMKMKNLSTELNLSEEQQAKIKPIAEQESAEVSGVIFTPVVSRKKRLSQWGKIVQSSDAKMKAILTQAQWQKLQEIRKDQKRELSDLIAKQDSAERNENVR